MSDSPPKRSGRKKGLFYSPSPAEWKPGQSGNPKGRPKGVKSRKGLTDKLIADLYTDWEKNGPAAIEAMRATSPTDYVRIIASLVPRQMEIKESAFDDLMRMDPADIARLLADELKDLGMEDEHVRRAVERTLRLESEDDSGSDPRAH